MTAITVTENVSVVNISSIPAEKANSFLFNVFEKAAESGINLDIISKVPSTNGIETICFTFSDEVMPKALAIFNNMKTDEIPAPMVNCGNVKYTVSSKEMIDNTGFAANVYKAISEAGATPLVISTGLDEISVIVGANEGAGLGMALTKIFLV